MESKVSGFKCTNCDGGGKHVAYGLCKKCYCKQYNKKRAEHTKQYYQQNKERIAEYYKQWHQQNKERIAERKKQYYQKNKEKYIERKKQWRQQNKEKIAEYNRQYNQQYYRKNKEKIAEYNKQNKERRAKYFQQYHQQNKEKRAKYFQQYRQTPKGKAIMKNDNHRRRSQCKQTDITTQWLENFLQKARKCAICKGKFEGEYPNPLSKSLDHIFPLVKGGTHTMANVQVAHLTCNLRKKARVEEGMGLQLSAI